MKTFRISIALFLCLATQLQAYKVALSWNASNPCDINLDGTVNLIDFTLAVDMAMNITPCNAAVEPLVTVNNMMVRNCTPITVKSIIDNLLSQVCTNIAVPVVGYNIYRGTVLGTYPTKLNSSPVTSTTFTDTTVQNGMTYYYVATSVDSAGDESIPSNQTTAIIPVN